MEVVPLALEFVAFVRMIYFGLKYISWKFKSLFSVTLSCGGSASENSTHIVQASATAVSSPCTYTICRCSTNICRIRFDFTVSKGKFTELVWCWVLESMQVYWIYCLVCASLLEILLNRAVYAVNRQTLSIISRKLANYLKHFFHFIRT